MHLAVRGFHGEGSESAGDFYQVSNQVTLGRSEEEILDELQGLVLPRIIDYERQARHMLASRNPTLLDDRVHRALAVLRSARLMRLEEAMKLLSRVRLGVHVGRITDVTAAAVNRLFLAVQPAHLQFDAKRALDDEDMKVARAECIRAALR
jgi:protein arginine kinase